MDSRWTRMTLRLSVRGVSMSLAAMAGCLTGALVLSLVIAALTPVTIKFTNGSLANDLPAPGIPGPVSSDSEPKPSAWRMSPRGPKEKETLLGVPSRGLADHPRHRPKARDTSQGPEVA